MEKTLRDTYLQALHAIEDAGGIEGNALRPIVCAFNATVPADRVGLAMIAAALHERQRRGYPAQWDAAQRDALTSMVFPEGASTTDGIGGSAVLPLLRLDRAQEERTDLLHEYVARMADAVHDRAARQPMEYILAELIANIWDHAETARGFIAVGADQHTMTMAVVDAGLSIPLSYARQGIEFPDALSYDSAAIDAALNGQSTRPQGGRGYGVRTSAALAVDGWRGSCLIASQRALWYHANGASPEREVGLLLWAGTVIAFSLPLPLRTVDLYGYIER